MIEVLQVYPVDDFKVYLYFNDGKIKLYNVKPLLDKGIFTKLADKQFFLERCTVLNHTLAWDVKENYDPYECIDLDPIVLYEKSIEAKDPLEN
ncbi:MAG: DUF2442 domain-containing protein [Leptospiraceae bacterium]|nr:DUF2442 domain-containing protein [Leptospiraceae bacterium]